MRQEAGIVLKYVHGDQRVSHKLYMTIERLRETRAHVVEGSQMFEIVDVDTLLPLGEEPSRQYVELQSCAQWDMVAYVKNHTFSTGRITRPRCRFPDWRDHH